MKEDRNNDEKNIEELMLKNKKIERCYKNFNFYLFKMNQIQKNNKPKLFTKSNSFAGSINNIPTIDSKSNNKPITIHHYINKDYILLENIIGDLKKKSNINQIVYFNKNRLKINKYNEKLNLVLGPKKMKDVKNINEIDINTKKTNNKNQFKKQLSAKLNFRNITEEMIKNKNKVNDMIYKNRFASMKKDLIEERIKINFLSYFVKHPSILEKEKFINNNLKLTIGNKYRMSRVQSAKLN